MVDPFTLGIAAWILSLAKGKKTADKLEYYPQNLQMIHGKLFLDMEILNPTQNKLKIDSVFAGIFADGKKVGNIEQGTPFTVSKAKRTKVQFPVELDPINAGKLLAAFVTGKAKNLKWSVKGVARALGLDNPISQDLSLT